MQNNNFDSLERQLIVVRANMDNGFIAIEDSYLDRMPREEPFEEFVELLDAIQLGTVQGTTDEIRFAKITTIANALTKNDADIAGYIILGEVAIKGLGHVIDNPNRKDRNPFENVYEAYKALGIDSENTVTSGINELIQITHLLKQMLLEWKAYKGQI